MTNQIQQIADWQESRQLSQMPYIHINEIINIFEECVEADGQLDSTRARALASSIASSYIAQDCTDRAKAVDAFCDIIVYSVGAIMKLQCNPMIAISECLKELADRTGSYSPTEGKWLKLPPKPDAYKADYSKSFL